MVKKVIKLVLIIVLFGLIMSSFIKPKNNNFIIKPLYNHNLKVNQYEFNNINNIKKDFLNINKVNLLGIDVSESYFDLRNVNGENYVTSVKNQQNTNLCWAFSAYGALESYLLLNQDKEYNFSERHLEYSESRYFLNDQINSESFNRNPGDGGNVFLSTPYFLNGKGPVLESDMPFQNNEELIPLTDIQNKETVIDVDGIKRVTNQYGSCTTNSIIAIKEHLKQYGALEAAIYMTADSRYFSNNSLYYNNGTTPNHGIVIVGWNDNYSRTNFSILNRPTSNGAWIAKNSYGTSFGINGYFYISYEDNIVCSDTNGFVEADDEIEDNSYYYDNLGYNCSFGSKGLNYAYAANKFTKSNNKELLTEVTIGLVEPTNYELYINSVNDDLVGSNVKLIKTGTFDYSGYGTIKLDSPITLEGTSFAIIIKYQLLSSNSFPIPIQVKDLENSLYYYAPHINGKSFISTDSVTWTDLGTFDSGVLGPSLSNPVLSIKAYTNNYSILRSNEYTVDLGYVKNISPLITYSNFIDNIVVDPSYTIQIKDQLGNIVTDGYIKTGLTLTLNDGENIANYTLVVNGDVTGDGRINIGDVAKVYQHLKGTNIIKENYYLKASDVVADNQIKINDVAKIYQYVKGIITEF